MTIPPADPTAAPNRLSQPPTEPLPPEWFARNSPPLEIDFGCHRGTFLIGMAARYPHHNFLGIERQPARVERCREKFARHQLTNALAITGSGPQSLIDHIPDASVSILHVSFPDPWPKRRHASRRLVDSAFLDQAARILKADGVLRLMTDDQSYFASMCQLTASGWIPRPWDDGREYVQTSFEKRFLAMGLTPGRLAIAPLDARRSTDWQTP